MKMKTKASSIRTQLICWLMIPVAALLVINMVIANLVAIDIADEAYDDSLIESAEAVLDRIRLVDGEALVDLPLAARAILKYNGKDQFYYQVLDSHGAIVSGDAEIPPPPLLGTRTRTGEPQIFNATVDHKPVRVASTVKQIGSSQFIVQVAETQNSRQQMVDKILLSAVAPQLLLVFLTAVAIWLGIRKGLRPLDSVQSEIAARSPSDLRLLDDCFAPRELRPIVASVNKLLNRISHDRDVQKRFAANAAHQLKTPLSGLKTQTQLLLRQEVPPFLEGSLKQINVSAERSVRLVNQLLTLARVEPGIAKLVPLKARDIERIARQAVQQTISQALDKSLDLSLECNLRDGVLLGDPESLETLVANLVENSVLYTPVGGRVTIVLEEDDAMRVVVEDNGPGIAADARERIFERFYRVLGSGVPGSGLGLAIVREIAKAHAASIRVDSGAGGCGTVISVDFPRAEIHADSGSEPLVSSFPSFSVASTKTPSTISSPPAI